MAWNTPNDQKPNDKDLWTGRPKKSTSVTPPLLEDLIKNFIKRLRRIKTPNTPERIPPKILAISGGLLVILLWALVGIHHIDTNQEGLVFRFGQYQESLGTGWHWQPWGIDRVILFDRDKSFNEISATDVISQDSSLAHIQIKVIYHVNDPRNYYLNSVHASEFIKAAASMALQQTAGINPLDAVLSSDKSSPFIQSLQQNIANTLDKISLGVQLDQVEIMNIAVPPEVQEIFNKVDTLYTEQEKQNESAADYEKQVLPPAQVKANQLIADAKAYAAQAKLKAQGEVADFLAVLPIYQQAPALTRYRLYTQTLQEILLKTTKVIVDEKANGTNVYLSPSTSVDNSTSVNTPDNTPAAAPASTPSASDSSNTTDDMYSEIKGGYS